MSFREAQATRNLSFIIRRYKISPFGRNDNLIIMQSFRSMFDVQGYKHLCHYRMLLACILDLWIPDKPIRGLHFCGHSVHSSGFTVQGFRSHFQAGMSLILLSMVISSSHVTIVPVGMDNSFIALLSPRSSLSKVFLSDISQQA